MLHPNRAHSITDRSDRSIEEFASELAEHSHVCCQGFRFRNLLLLNDATSEDGAQEFAVIRCDRHVEYLNCSWNDAASVARQLKHLLSSTDLGINWAFTLNPHPDGPCPLCR